MIAKSSKIRLQFLYKMPSLFFGFFLYAVAILLALYSDLGMSPWDVLHTGIVNNSVLSLGQVSQLVGFCVIVISVFLGVIPGIATVFNMIFIGIFVDLINKTGILKTPVHLLAKIFMLILAILIMGMATYFYLKVELGAGPRDGLMEGLVKKFNKPVWLIRGLIEIIVLIVGFFLGGLVGIGTLILAFSIGPSLQLAFKLGKYDSRKAHHTNLIAFYQSIKGEIRKKSNRIVK